MRYLKAGSGPPLILIHGLLGYSFSFRFTLPALAPYTTSYAIDNLGFGLSPSKEEMDCGLRATSERVLQFADALGIQEFDILGSSYGGAVAIMVAALSEARNNENSRGSSTHEQSKVRRMILAGPVNPWSPHGKRLAPALGSALGSVIFRNTIAKWRVFDYLWLSRMFGDTKKIPPDSLNGYRVPIQKNNAILHGSRVVKSWSADMAELEKALPKTRDYRTLLLWGTEDHAVDFRSAEPLQKNFRDVRLVKFKGAGHLLYEEVPEEFNRAVIDFLIEPIDKKEAR